MSTIAQNVIVKRDGNMCWIGFDVTQRHGPSSTGKTITVASTRGNADVPGPDTDGMRVGLNVFVPANASQPQAPAQAIAPAAQPPHAAQIQPQAAQPGVRRVKAS